jgi:hypothetical protein
MKPSVLCCIAALLGAAVPERALAQEPSSSCSVLPSWVDLATDHDGARSRFEQLPLPCLKAIFVQCSDAASEQVLDFGSAAACSIGYEALLKRGFSGDFQSLLAWWRTQRPRDGATN